MNIKSTSKRWKGGGTKDKIRYKSRELFNTKPREASRAMKNTSLEGNKKEDSKEDSQMQRS